MLYNLNKNQNKKISVFNGIVGLPFSTNPTKFQNEGLILNTNFNSLPKKKNVWFDPTVKSYFKYPLLSIYQKLLSY